MKFYVLASGSKGNCTVIQSGESTIVIDAGTTDRHLKASFKEINIDYKNVDALLITHTHSDHINRINLFKDITMYTPEFLGDKYRQKPLYGEDQFQIKDFEIETMTLSHDRALTLGYIIKSNNQKLVYVTDTGYFKDNHLEAIYNADYYIFESNHDPMMLMETDRPFILKQRIMAMDGHLSNEDSGLVLSRSVGTHTKEIVLAHLSEEANDHHLALQSMREHIYDEKIIIKAAKQFEILYGGQNNDER
ncbi:MAG: MBL fold metallo-hydrolase [Erysipelothrix sp.]|nr:MBL fold metallo-hydrolase [Erysipelothrix sp.]